MAAKWSPTWRTVQSEPFPLIRRSCSERPGAVKGAPLLGAAQRTLDGEDRSEMIAEEGKAGRNIGETWPPKWYPRPPPLTVVAVIMGLFALSSRHWRTDRVSQDVPI